jgi:hypothetical protein
MGACEPRDGAPIGGTSTVHRAAPSVLVQQQGPLVQSQLPSQQPSFIRILSSPPSNLFGVPAPYRLY